MILAISRIPVETAQYNHALVRENALYLSWLTEDYVQLGEIEHAASLAMRVAALAGHTDSARADTRLRHVAKQLSPYRNTAAVAEFFGSYESSAGAS
jgi:hypothetical protein